MTQLQFLRELEAIKTHSQLVEAMTRNEFSAFMAKGLKGLLLDGYRSALQETTYQELCVEDSSESDHENYPSGGQPELPKQILEDQDMEVLNSGSPDDVGVTNYSYGGIIEITNEAATDDRTPGRALIKQAQDLGPNHARFKDKICYSIITGNGAIYDSNNFFSLNHPGYTGGAARGNNDNIYTNVTMTANALAVTLATIALWEGADPDQDLEVQPTKVVCPRRLENTAYGLTRADLLPYAYAAGPLGPATTGGAVGMPNRLKGKLGVVVSYRLDRVSVTDWYVWTDFPGLLHLQREPLSVVQEAVNSGKNFSAKKLRWASYERFRCKPINWRCGILVS